MFSGYLFKRNVPISPPSMQRVFAVLWGTLLFDYESEEDSKTSMSPKVASEILGISEWDGQGRANKYPNGFLLVTHTGGTYYLSTSSLKERDDWIVHVKRALECNFANSEIIPFKPSKMIHSRPQKSALKICAKTRQPLNLSIAMYCKACGRGFSSAEHVQELSNMLQIGIEEQDKCCIDCRNTQFCVMWLKSMNYIHVMNLHELTPLVANDLLKFKATFLLRKRQSSRLNMASQLLDQGNITLQEFEELRKVDNDYRRELVYEESEMLKMALDTIGDDMQMIIGLLINPSSTESGGRLSYYQVIIKLLEVADEDPELVDFYLPQILQAHLLEANMRTAASMVKLDLLQQALLVLAKNYPPLALKISWALLSISNDFQEKKVSQAQFAASVCLLLQLELVVVGSVSIVADIPMCKILSKVLTSSSHQQDEIAMELSTLFLMRRKLQEVYDHEATQRTIRNNGQKNKNPADQIAKNKEIKKTIDNLQRKIRVLPTPPPPSPQRNSSNPSQQQQQESLVSNTTTVSSPTKHIKKNKNILSNDFKSCVETLHELGVGKAKSNSLGDLNEAEHYLSQIENDIHKASEINICEQLDFIDRLNEVVESLRFMDRNVRGDAFKKELAKWNDAPVLLGWDPTTLAAEPQYRIVKIHIEDCRVFKTKARAPSLVVCEVLRQDLTFYDNSSLILGYSKNKDNNINRLSETDFRRTNTKSTRRLSGGSTEELVQLDGLNVEGFINSSITQAIADIHKIKLENQNQNEVNNVSDPVVDFLPPPPPSSTPSTPSMKDVSNKLPFENMNEKEIITEMSNSSLQQKQTPFEGLIEESPKGDMKKSLSSSSILSITTSSSSSSKSTDSLDVNSTRSIQKRKSVKLIANRNSAWPQLNLHFNNLPTQPKETTVVQTSKNSKPLQNIPQPIISQKDTQALKAKSGKDKKKNEITERTDTIEHMKRVIKSAQVLLHSGRISQTEYEELVKCESRYLNEYTKNIHEMTISKIESAFGESWEMKKQRLLGDKYNISNKNSGQHGIDSHDTSDDEDFWPVWDLRCFIVKSNDDLRQEVCCLQIMQICKEIFESVGLKSQLWLKPYRIVSTNSTTGIVQVLTDAMSLDALKKTPGFTTLSNFFRLTYGFSEDTLMLAKRNFVSSLAAYSLFSYILLIKDRHNGNILLGAEGHIMHIDFGFILSIAPGGSFSLETAPFKLTEEILEVMGGLESALFGEFVKAFTAGFLALRANAEHIVSNIHILSQNSSFPCFTGKDSAQIVERLRQRFRTDLSIKDAVQHCMDLIISSYAHYGTKQYDSFQWYTNGIIP